MATQIPTPAAPLKNSILPRIARASIANASPAQIACLVSEFEACLLNHDMTEIPRNSIAALRSTKDDVSLCVI